MANLITPLSADLFLAISPTNGNHHYHDSPRSDASAAAQLPSVLKQMRPVSTVVARDDQLMHALGQLMVGQHHAAEWARVQQCVRMQPLPRMVFDDREQGEEFAPIFYQTHFQTGACSPQLSLALRHRMCLSLLERAEDERGDLRYEWVVRSRPDIALPCAVPFPAVFDTKSVQYVVDFIAFMPRAAADTVLRQVPLARHLNASKCFDASVRSLDTTLHETHADGSQPHWHIIEDCSPCLAQLRGWGVGGLRARVWAPSASEYVSQDFAYPARERNSESGSQSFSGAWTLWPYPPFGNVSSPDDNPLVPVGGIYPRCALAADGQSARRKREPYLVREPESEVDGNCK